MQREELNKRLSLSIHQELGIYIPNLEYVSQTPQVLKTCGVSRNQGYPSINDKSNETSLLPYEELVREDFGLPSGVLKTYKNS